METPIKMMSPPLALAFVSTGMLIGASLAYVFLSQRAVARPVRARTVSSSSSDEDDDEEDETDPTQEEMKMVFLVNDTLKMTKGKIVAQCCHACLASANSKRALPYSEVWRRQGQAKITLKTDDPNALLRVEAQAKAMKLPCYLVHDAGRTQIAAGSMTVVGVGPAPKSLIDQLTGGFKLL